MPKWGISKISPLAILSILFEKVGRSATHLAPELLIKGNQPKQRDNVTAHAWSWELEWGWYSITKEMIRKICGSEPGLGSGVVLSAMYVG